MEFIAETKQHSKKQNLAFEKQQEVISEYENNIIGWIEFDGYNQKNPIMLGTSDEILNKEIVGLHVLSEILDKENNEIILAAHNKKGLFNIITELKINDKVKIISFKDIYIFLVEKIEKYDKNSMLEFQLSRENRVLKLITCIDNNEKRLVITLKELKFNR